MGDLILVSLCCVAQVRLTCLTNPPQRPEGDCCTSMSDLSSTTKCDQKLICDIITSVAPKAGAMHELLFHKPAPFLFNKSSCLAQALGVIKFTYMGELILVTFVVLLKSVLNVYQTQLSLRAKR
jgi:hypothetical protein